MTPEHRRRLVLDRLRGAPVTAHEVAEQLGTSVRTVYRDVDALREQGYTIAASAGHGGGLRLDTSSRPRPVELSLEEVLGLVLAVGVLRAGPDLPFADGATLALGRLFDAVPRGRARELRRLVERVVVGPPLDPEASPPTDPVSPELLEAFEQAFTRRRQLSFRYCNARGEDRHRRVAPMALLVRPPAWYAVAWDLDKDARRLFRMDRMSEAEVGDAGFVEQPFVVPHGFRCPDLD